MPRGPRLDAPGALHHVMARGIEKTLLFRTDEDRRDFVHRLAAQVEAGGAHLLAWALLPTHFHLLLRTGPRPLAALMRRLLTGYAAAFNRRHHRHGHLFQNRYRSIVVEEEPYLLELVRYLHLNPLRAMCVPDLPALERYPWSGHSALLGRVTRPWQAIEEVLRYFGPTPRTAQQRYAQFVASGVARGRRPELQGGGLRRSAGGWTALAALRRGRELWSFDERVLGTGPFVEHLLTEAGRAIQVPSATAAWQALPRITQRVAAVFQVAVGELTGGSRRREVANARAAAGAVAVRHLGLPVSRVAAAFGVTSMAILRGIDRGLAALQEHGVGLDQLVKEGLQ